MTNNSDQKKHHAIVLSGKKDLVNTSPLVGRGLDLAKNIKGLTVYKASLLWVDDEPDILLFAKRFFGPKGYKVATFENGVDVLEELKKNNYDIFITTAVPS